MSENNKDTCCNCENSYERKNSCVLWCKLKGDIAPTWYWCPKHAPKEMSDKA